MKALLICPADRPAVAPLAESTPLVTAPLLGKCLLEYWIEALVARGAKHLVVLASDRPTAVRAALREGTPWGIRVELLPQSRELTPAEARSRYRGDASEAWLEEDVIVLDRLPGRPDLPLFASYAGWLAAVQAWIPRAVTPTRIGVREVSPGIWVGLHAQIAASARLVAPCWIGERALIGAGTTIGPGAIVEDRAVIETGARVTNSTIGPDTFVGRHIAVADSLALGSTVISCRTGSCLHVPDAFLLCSLNARPFTAPKSSAPARAAALLALLATAPLALVVALLALLRGDSPWQLRLGVRPQRHARRSALDTFAYYELNGAGHWLRRWPQFWSVFRGDLTWFGNRPLRPTQALALANDFERLWLAAPVGLISLADAHGCPASEISDEACAHASFYAVNASRRLDWFILRRSFARVLAVWPILRSRRKDTGVPLPQVSSEASGLKI